VADGHRPQPLRSLRRASCCGRGRPRLRCSLTRSRRRPTAQRCSFADNNGNVVAYNYLCRTDGGICAPAWTTNHQGRRRGRHHRRERPALRARGRRKRPRTQPGNRCPRDESSRHYRNGLVAGGRRRPGYVTTIAIAARARACVLVLDPPGQAIAMTATDTRGYVVEGVPAGRWNVEFVPDDGCMGNDTADAFHTTRERRRPEPRRR
jgi:hypothetical protein